MLTRIYGTAWNNDKDLEKYLTSIEEALKRDHRKLGKEMDLFHFQDEAPGMVFWHPYGWNIYKTLQNYIRNKLDKNDYLEINTPQVVDRKLWEALEDIRQEDSLRSPEKGQPFFVVAAPGRVCTLFLFCLAPAEFLASFLKTLTVLP